MKAIHQGLSIISSLVLSAGWGWAEQSIDSDCLATQTQTVYFGNGVWVPSEQDAENSLKDLEDLLITRMPPQQFSATCFAIAINQSVSKASDVIESTAQILGNEYPTLTIGHLLGLSGLSTFFISPSAQQQLNDLLRSEAARKLVQTAISTTDVAAQVASYKKDISDGRKIVVVAHSQGNLFVNRAFEDLNSVEQNSFAMIPVASPDISARRSLVGHVTFIDDLIIDLVQSIRLAAGLPLALSPNDSILFERGTFWGHEFSLNYLKDASSTDFIVNGAITSLSALPSPLNQPPTASFILSVPGKAATPNQTLNLTVNPNEAAIVSFDGTPSADPDGAIASYEWRSNGDRIPTSTLFTARTFTFGLGKGTYVITLVVTDNRGARSNAAQGTIVVAESAPPQNQPPTAGFVMTSQGKSASQGQSLNLTIASGGTASVSFDGSFPTYSKDDSSVTGWQWKVGTTVVSSSPTFTQSFPVGTYNISLVVTDNQGVLSTIATGIIVVSAQVAPMFTITDLGTLGGSASAGFAINKSAQVAGYTFLAGDRTAQAFRWDGSAMQLLPTLGPIFSNLDGAAQAWGINSSGQVVGFSYTVDPQTGLYMQHAIVWNGTAITDLGIGWGNYSVAKGINDSGQIIGFVGNSGTGSEHAAIWTGSSVQDIGSLSSIVGNSEAQGINKLGQVTGNLSTSASGSHGFFFDGSTMKDIGSFTTANSINDSGQITGRFDDPFRAYIWKDGLGVRDIGVPLGSMGAEGRGINNSGQVVGVAFMDFSLSQQHAFLFDGTSMWDLNNQVTNLAGWTELTSAQAINDSGQITGYGTINGQQHAFLLTPAIKVIPNLTTGRYMSLSCSSLPDPPPGYEWVWGLADRIFDGSPAGVYTSGTSFGPIGCGSKPALENGYIFDLSSAAYPIPSNTDVYLSAWIADAFNPLIKDGHLWPGNNPVYYGVVHWDGSVGTIK